MQNGQRKHFSGADFGSLCVFLVFFGLVCFEKWSYNFDSGTRNAIYGTPKMAKWGRFSNFVVKCMHGICSAHKMLLFILYN